MITPRIDQPDGWSSSATLGDPGYRRRPGPPIHGTCGMLAGGATVPGLALIDTLPFVWQMVLKSVLWQVGRASATGAEIAAAAASPAINATELRRWVIGYSPFELIGLPFRGRRRRRRRPRGRAACCWPQRGQARPPWRLRPSRRHRRPRRRWSRRPRTRCKGCRW